MVNNSNKSSSKIYDLYEANSIMSIAIVKKKDIKHSTSDIREIYKKFNGHELNNSKNYIAICVSGKEKKTGAKQYTFYGLLPQKKDVKGTFDTLIYLSVAPGCYEYDNIRHKDIPISMSMYPFDRPSQQEFRFESDIYGKNMLYIISIYSGPGYRVQNNYMYYPITFAYFVIDTITSPLQAIGIAIAALVLKDIGPISP